MNQHPVAIITGASRGIGRGIALALAREGFDLVINYASNAAAAEEVRHEAQSHGVRALLVRADVASAADRTSLVEQALSSFGRINLLVNNAGVAPDVRADVLELSERSFDRLMGINLKGPFFLTQQVARHMLEQVGSNPHSAASPKIININSVSAYAVSVNRADYCMTKAALAMLTSLYAVRLAQHGINVYEIRPGVIETDMTGPVKARYDDLIFNKDLTPIRRWGQVEDVAKAVIAIVKGYLPFSTGEVINVDGGFHVRRL